MGWKSAARRSFYLNLPYRFRDRWLELSDNFLPSPLVSPALQQEVGLEERLRDYAYEPARRGRRFATDVAKIVSAANVRVVPEELALCHAGLSVAPAHPFIDRRVLQFGLTLPWEAMCPSPVYKELLVELSTRRLPPVPRGYLKADLSEYYKRAAGEVEFDRIRDGLALAADMPAEVDPNALGALLRTHEAHEDFWMPSRVAMLARWFTHLRS